MFEGVMNVGLRIDATGYMLEVSDVVDAAEKCGVIMGKPTVVGSDTEPTVVATIVCPTQRDVWDMAKMLHQDCIAVYDSRNWRGHLIGPKSDSWGAFDPQQFVTSTGKRLSDLLVGVA